jgi:transposase-like protein
VTADASAPRDAMGHFVSPYDPQKRAEVRADYEAPVLTLQEICKKHGIAANTVQKWMRAEGWRMRQPHRIDPNDLVGRMLELLDGQIADLEIAMMNGAAEVAMLSKLVTTLDRVIALKERTAKVQAAPSMRVLTLRTKIADRLIELNRA